MSEVWTVPKDEHGVIRLFALNLPTGEAKALAAEVAASGDGGPLRAMLGVVALDPEFVEVFPVSNLEGLGLAEYVITGLGAPRDDVVPFKPQLDSLTGSVAVVLSKAFGGVEQTLSPATPLRHVVTFHEPLPTPSFEPLTSEGAKGRLGGAPAAEPQPVRGPRTRRLAALVILFAVLAGIIAVVR